MCWCLYWPHELHHAHHVETRVCVLSTSFRLAGGLFSPLGAPVLEPHLNSGFVQAEPVGQLFALVSVRVGRLLKGSLEQAELVVAEHGSARTAFN